MLCCGTQMLLYGWPTQPYPSPTSRCQYRHRGYVQSEVSVRRLAFLQIKGHKHAVQDQSPRRQAIEINSNVQRNQDQLSNIPPQSLKYCIAAHSRIRRMPPRTQSLDNSWTDICQKWSRIITRRKMIHLGGYTR